MIPKQSILFNVYCLLLYICRPRGLLNALNAASCKARQWYTASLLRSGKFTQGAQTRTVKVQQPDADDANDAQAAEQRNTPGDAEVPEERVGEEHAPAGQGAPEEVVCGEQAGGVLRVAQRDVDEDALHDDEAGGGVDGDAGGRGDPVDRLAGGPGKDEQADGRAKGGGQRGREAALLDGQAEAADARVDVQVEVGAVDGGAEEAGDEDAEEDEPRLAEVHVVVDGVDEGEGLEEGVVDAVDDGGVDLDEEHGRVLEGDLDGLDEGVEQGGAGPEAALVQLRLRHEARAAGAAPEPTGPAEEDGGPTRLRERDQHAEEHRRRRPHALVQRPAPAARGHGEARQQRAQRRAKVGRRDPRHHGVGQRRHRVHVAEGRAARGQARRPEEALQEAQHHQAGEAARQGGGDGQHHEEDHGGRVDGVPADAGDLAERREDERADAVAQHVQRQAERGLELRHVEPLHDALRRGRVDGRRRVHDKGVEADDGGDEAALPVAPVLRVLGVVAVVPVHEDGAVLCEPGNDGDRLHLFHGVRQLGLEAGARKGRRFGGRLGAVQAQGLGALCRGP